MASASEQKRPGGISKPEDDVKTSFASCCLAPGIIRCLYHIHWFPLIMTPKSLVTKAEGPPRSAYLFFPRRR
ncbi:hypothetical protein CCM_00669 [Cordyceps militaris CM01]|uniref:Uncharacterized protein n=1 Tax=Cordyceps militaris (strain CM01) TaxID=983644 RepID=G3J5F3_CORMM|nr:uncharacterized protein CCM_00669 [Cordyceps militaris CM01]EGX96014.1 hypothetical protein CCM_00669 [Cordyceps militaris CM01]